MPNYLELRAKPRQPHHHELTLLIDNPENYAITVIWTVELPNGIREFQCRELLNGRTVVPARRKVVAYNWLIAIESADAYLHGEIKVQAEIFAPGRQRSDELRVCVVQVQVA